MSLSKRAPRKPPSAPPLVRFRPDPALFNPAHAPLAELGKLEHTLEDLALLAPRLGLTWTFAAHREPSGDDATAGGLAAYVARAAQCPIDGVAHHRGSHETRNGPIDVEVALAWRDPSEPAFTSFVNYARTPGHGSHVDGLIDGVHAFLGGRRATASLEGLTAAVAVVLADVKYGNPTKDRLDTLEARGPAAEATRAALAAWALAYPEAATALRARGSSG